VTDVNADARTRAAVDELQQMILARYRTATFQVSRSQDDPRAVHLTTIVDLDDPGEVLDLVIDRVIDFQVDEDIPVHVIPMPTPSRILAEMSARERRRMSASTSAGHGA
jgi:hypothetical protein